MKWILIFIVAGSGSGFSTEFNNRESCQEAGRLLASRTLFTVPQRWGDKPGQKREDSQWICVPKGRQA